jgi:hypothetical protein
MPHKLKESEFTDNPKIESMSGFSLEEVRQIKKYCLQHGYIPDFANKKIYDKDHCCSVSIIKDNTGHICAVNNGIKEDITENIIYGKYIASKVKISKHSSFIKSLGDVFGLVSLTHTGGQ